MNEEQREKIIKDVMQNRELAEHFVKDYFILQEENERLKNEKERIKILDHLEELEEEWNDLYESIIQFKNLFKKMEG